eukprot:c6126_g1_i1.p1 GENE.c6126_g1_i1~~c6126_g1_i1.p1  ORF type:complete len:356 (-),score=112.95 c6126_g1_i1:14-1081(-)
MLVFALVGLTLTFPLNENPTVKITDFWNAVHEKSMAMVHHTSDHSLGVGMTFPIDVVITWFNSHDENALKAFNTRMKQTNQKDLPSGAGDSKRFNDAGELRYNLRSIEKNAASWFRKIFIVLADDMQLPSWMSRDSPRLRIIRHSEIFSSSTHLPTFNSHAIESRIHHIPDLSEHFIYLNDDMFINQPTTSGTFFSPNGKPFAWPGAVESRKSHEAHWIAVHNTLRILDIHKWPASRSLHHQAKPMTVTAMRRAEEVYRKQFEETESHPFRSKSDIWPILLASILCVEEGQCELETHPPASYFSNVNANSVWNAIQEINNQHPILVCLNDSDPGASDAIDSALASRFPEKSRFEK